MTPGSGAAPTAMDRAAARLSRLPIFSSQDYLAANPDVARAGVDPVAHLLDNGAREGRTLFAEIAVARAYGRAAQRVAPAEPSGDWRRAGASPRRCTVFLHSGSDEAYREVAQDLVDDIAGLGLDADLADERADPTEDHGAAIVVAPHDFFHLGLGPLWGEAGALGDAVVVVDDPIDSVEGGASLRSVLDARGVIDLSAVGVGIWSTAGIPTLHLRPRVRLRNRWLAEGDLAHPLMLAAPERTRRPDVDPLAWDGRPLDLLYFARETPHRNAALGRLAGTLAAHRGFVYAAQGVVSQGERDLQRGAHWRISGHLSAQARLSLVVPEGRFPALERRRVVVQAMAGGSAVVSTARFSEPGLEAGTHYFHEDGRHVGELIDWLVADPDGRREALRVRERAFDRIAALNRDPPRLAGLREILAGPDRGGRRAP